MGKPIIETVFNGPKNTSQNFEVDSGTCVDARGHVLFFSYRISGGKLVEIPESHDMMVLIPC